jgi:hypothetical protein
MRQTFVRPLCLLLLALVPTGCWASRPHPPEPRPELGYPDADLPYFAPATGGMTWTSHNYDMAGHSIGTELEELEDFSNSPPLTRRYKVTEDVEDGPSQITHFVANITHDSIEGVTEETSRAKVLLKTPLVTGTTWTYSRGAGAGEERRTIVAIEDVCTRWGLFPRAIKVLGMTLGPRSGGGGPLRTRTEEWFVKGLGRVQVIARVEGKPALDLISVLEGLIDPAADEPFSPPSCTP